MLHIFNKTIPNFKSLLYSLTILYGINQYQSKKICRNIGINPKITLDKLKRYQVNRLTKYINKNLKIEQILKQLKEKRLKELLEMKNTRGIRRSLGLPVHGQRTHSNAKTIRKFKKISINIPTKKISKKKNNNRR
jgi:small subunit ribosomal protein S13